MALGEDHPSSRPFLSIWSCKDDAIRSISKKYKKNRDNRTWQIYKILGEKLVSVGVVNAQDFVEEKGLDDGNGKYNVIGIKSLFVVLGAIPAEAVDSRTPVSTLHLWKQSLPEEKCEHILEGVEVGVLEVISTELLDWRTKEQAEEERQMTPDSMPL
jgi:hypothetical protein